MSLCPAYAALATTVQPSSYSQISRRDVPWRVLQAKSDSCADMRADLNQLLFNFPERSFKYWSEWQDLNLRPPRPERGSGPAEFASAFASELLSTG